MKNPIQEFQEHYQRANERVFGPIRPGRSAGGPREYDRNVPIDAQALKEAITQSQQESDERLERIIRAFFPVPKTVSQHYDLSRPEFQATGNGSITLQAQGFLSICIDNHTTVEVQAVQGEAGNGAAFMITGSGNFKIRPIPDGSKVVTLRFDKTLAPTGTLIVTLVSTLLPAEGGPA